MSLHGGVMPRVVRSLRGFPDPDEVELLCRKKEYYDANVSLLLLENTHNHAGGTVLPMAAKHALIRAARMHGVAVHLDGARLFNAATALRLPPHALASGFDACGVCLS